MTTSLTVNGPGGWDDTGPLIAVIIVDGPIVRVIGTKLGVSLYGPIADLIQPQPGESEARLARRVIGAQGRATIGPPTPWPDLPTALDAARARFPASG